MEKVTITMDIKKSMCPQEASKRVEWDFFFVGKKLTKKEIAFIHKEIEEDILSSTRHNITGDGYNYFDMSDVENWTFNLDYRSKVKKEGLKARSTYFFDRNYESGKFLITEASKYKETSISGTDSLKLFQFMKENKEEVEDDLEVKFNIDEASILDLRFLHNQYAYYNAPDIYI